ncbi:OmpA family protein [Photobacterium leiognathi]|uniref:OmpA family protein n=1 Tax=Photobacterium leiognathi TaxID=553611 RepID=UPI0027375087|nr:OmpA family protein [Photobacterium leiognathi]
MVQKVSSGDSFLLGGGVGFEFSDHFSGEAIGNISSKSVSFDLYPLIKTDITNNVDAYAFAGMSFNDLSEGFFIGPVAGVGLSYDISKNLETSINYKYNSIYDVDFGTLNLMFKFNLNPNRTIKIANKEPVYEKINIIKSNSFSVYFPFDSTIYYENDKMIDVISSLVSKGNNKNLMISVNGYSDEIGNYKYNYNLSLKRAYVIRDLLISKGIPSNNIKISANGEVSSGKYHQNRRVDVNFTYED